MACCTTDGSISGSSFGYPNTNHCDVWTPPSGGATMEFGHQFAGMSNLSAVYEHPATWPIEEDGWCRDRILYKGTIIEAKSNKATAGDTIYSEDIGTRVGVPLSSSGFASYTAALNFFLQIFRLNPSLQTSGSIICLIHRTIKSVFLAGC